MATLARGFGAILVLLAGCASASAAGKSDAATLLKLSSVWGPDFAGNKTWKLSNPCSKWFGVTCSGNKGFNVTSLNLFNSQLVGPILPQIADLKGLAYLNLSSSCFDEFLLLGLPRDADCSSPYNTLEGSFPRSFSTMTQLRVLALGSPGELNGSWSTISSLTRLQGLSLLGKASLFSGIVPRSLTAFSRLTHLDLGFCGFSGPFPTAVTSLTRLEALRLQGNNFTGKIPSSLSRFTKLKVLTLSANNFFGGVPSFLGSLRGLRVLNLDGQIRSFSEQSRFLAGSIPHSLGQLQNLEELTIMLQNITSSLPASLGSLKKLTTLLLALNGISGRIPNAYSGMVSLQYAFLPYNQLEGRVPKTLVNLPDLKGLLLSYNSLSGALPKLPKLVPNIPDAKNYPFLGFSFTDNFLTQGPCSTADGLVKTDLNCIGTCGDQKAPEICEAFKNGTLESIPALSARTFARLSKMMVNTKAITKFTLT